MVCESLRRCPGAPVAVCHRLQTLNVALGLVCPHYQSLELSLLSQCLLWPSSLPLAALLTVAKSEGTLPVTEARQKHAELASTCPMPGSQGRAYLPEACPGAAQDPAELGEELWASISATVLASIAWLL